MSNRDSLLAGFDCTDSPTKARRRPRPPAPAQAVVPTVQPRQQGTPARSSNEGPQGPNGNDRGGGMHRAGPAVVAGAGSYPSSPSASSPSAPVVQPEPLQRGEPMTGDAMHGEALRGEPVVDDLHGGNGDDSPPPEAGGPAAPGVRPRHGEASGSGTSVLDYTPSPTARRFHASRSIFRGIMGPIGSGKSVACCWELFRLACAQAPFNGVRKSRWGVIRATYAELLTTTLRTWKDWFPPHLCPLREHDAPITGRMQLPLPDGTKLDMEVIFVAVEREEDTRKLLSMELTGVYFNEARELPFGVIRDAMGRTGRYPSKREGGHTRKAAIADTNPPDSEHWWYKLAEEKRLSEDAEPVEDKDFAFFRQPPALMLTEQGYAPNPHAENVNNLTDGFGYWVDQIPGRDAEWIKVYILGEYGSIMDGKPVYGRSYVDSIHTSKVPFLPIKGMPLIVSFDFGRTPAVVFMQQTPRGQVRVLHEIITEGTDIRALCRNGVRPLLSTVFAGTSVYITGDPTGGNANEQDSVSCYQIIEEELAGLFVEWVPATTNSPTERQDAVRRLLARLTDGVPGFQVSPKCTATRKGFQGGYKYRTIRMGGGQMRTSTIPDKNMYSHIHDAIQYGCMYLLGGGLATSVNTGMRQEAPVGAADAVAGY